MGAHVSGSMGAVALYGPVCTRLSPVVADLDGFSNLLC